MNVAVVPAPNGMPERIGQIQCTSGVQVQANHSPPIGTKMAPIHTINTGLSGVGRPSASSFRFCTSFRSRGSQKITKQLPTPMPRYEHPV